LTSRCDRRHVLLPVALLVLSTFSVPAKARSEAEWPWDGAAIWTSVVRYLRVDRQFPVREKDDKAGYVIFDYLEGGRSYRGTLEIVASPSELPSGSKVLLQLTELPRRYEAVFLEELAKKLRAENGVPRPPAAPAPRPTPSPAPAPPDRNPSDGGLPNGLPRAPTLNP